MTLYSAPPPARTFEQDKATLLVAWWTTLLSTAIILFRVAGRYVRTERLFREDRLAFACLIPLYLRMAFVHAVLRYGTNNAEVDGLSELSIQHRIIGSRLVLVSRITYAATLWMLKLTITEFLKRLTLQIWTHSYEVTLRCIRWFLLLTFIAIFLSDLVECHPVTHYWQVTPDPGGHCRQAYAQLLTTAICNILTDLLLVIFPIPIILYSSMPLSRKLQLICLFGLSTIPIAITFYQIPEIIDKGGRQQTRSLWASIEILAATSVANALVLGSFVRDRGVKKHKWKVGSFSESLERTISLRGTIARAWGSDEDLVRGLGIGVDRELRHHRNVSHTPRPAPIATSGSDITRTFSTFGDIKNTPSNNRAWDFPPNAGHQTFDAQDTSSEDYDLLKIERRNHDNDNDIDDDDDDPDLPPMITPRKMSFFDVGGLLDSTESSHSSRREPQRASEASTNTTDATTSSTLSTLPPDVRNLSNNYFLPKQPSSQSQAFAFAHPTSLSPTPQLQSPNRGSSLPGTSTIPIPNDRRGSAALFRDLGGLLTPLNLNNTTVSSSLLPDSQSLSQSRPHPHSRRHSDSINGIGLRLPPSPTHTHIHTHTYTTPSPPMPTPNSQRPALATSRSATTPTPYLNPQQQPINWTQNPFGNFSFSSREGGGGGGRSFPADESDDIDDTPGPDEVFTRDGDGDDAIQLRRMRVDGHKSAENENEEIRDVGGLLEREG